MKRKTEYETEQQNGNYLNLKRKDELKAETTSTSSGKMSGNCLTVLHTEMALTVLITALKEGNAKNGKPFPLSG